MQKDDVIYRQQAIDALGEAPKYKQRIIKTYAEGRNDQWFDDVTKLTLIPSAQPEGKKGVFIPDITVEMLRKASLEAVDDLLTSGEMKDIVLPSAQPVNYGSTKSDSSSQLKLNNDLISRQDVLKILSSKNAAWDAYDKVKRLPSAQPERKKGKWIKLDMHAHIADHKCTACGQECYVPTCMGEPMYTYCPNCGARMEGESDE